MTEAEMRRLLINMNAAVLLSRDGDGAAPKSVNRAVQLASDIEKSVRKRLRWEARQRGDDEEERG